MTLTDSGPLVALLNRDDKYHSRCVEILPAIRLPLLITMPVLTEAMYFLGDRVGWAAQQRVWEMVRHGRVQIAESSPSRLERMEILMEKYRDIPMDLADASLVALAEAENFRQVFTLDRHFRAYRLSDRRVFQIVPEME